MRRRDGSGSVFNDFGCHDSQPVWLMPIACHTPQLLLNCVCARQHPRYAICRQCAWTSIDWNGKYPWSDGVTSVEYYYIVYFVHFPLNWPVQKCEWNQMQRCTSKQSRWKYKSDLPQFKWIVYHIRHYITWKCFFLFQSKIAFNGNVCALFFARLISSLHLSHLEQKKHKPARQMTKSEESKNQYLCHYLIVGAFTRDQAFDGIQASKCNARRQFLVRFSSVMLDSFGTTSVLWAWLQHSHI